MKDGAGSADYTFCVTRAKKHVLHRNLLKPTGYVMHQQV